jgi:uncharacterized protein (TIGR02302 family)
MSGDRQRAARRAGNKLGLARAALAWERLWPALWPAAAVAGLFLTAALLDLLPWLGGWLHLLALVAFGGGFAAALWRGLRGMRLPGEAAARRRLETASGLPHRPLEALDDELAAGRHDPLAEALWQAHQRRLLRGMARLRVGWPAPGVPRRDRLALRGGLVLVLAVAIVAGGQEPLSRMARALSPDLTPIAAARQASLDLWITPPAYTGLAPVFLQSGSAAAATNARTDRDTPIVVLAGSTLLAQVNGGAGSPVLHLGGREIGFTKVDAATHHVTVELAASGGLRIEQGGEQLGEWRLEVVPDTPPKVEFATPPARTGRAAMRLEYQAEDDFGLTGVRARITRADAADRSEGAAAIELGLTLPGRRLTEARSVSFHDLTAHVWAGIPVDIRLEATDAIDQTGTSDAFRTVLPERIFNHPVARAIVEQRKQLTLDPEANAAMVAEVLRGLAARPNHYYDDIVVFLALTTAASRVLADSGPGSVAAVQRLLWDTALRIEDGKLSIAGRDLREAQQRLMQALADNAVDEEIQRLMDELQAALDEYLQALAEELARQQQTGALQQMIDPQAVMMDRLDLQRMIDRARELARAGARDAARQMLSQLQELLENLRSGAMGQMDQRSRQAMQSMRDLQELINRQHQLLNETFRRSQRGQQGQQEGGQGQLGQPQGGEIPGDEARAAQRQGALRSALGELARRLDELTGSIPGGFGRADQAMRDATKALRQGLPGDAVGPQTEALDQLQQAARALSEQMMQQMGGQGLVAGPGGPGRRRGPGNDPFGRPRQDGGAADTSNVRIPDEADLQRARAILDELRRRAGDRQRPSLELDYIDRLMRRF